MGPVKTKPSNVHNNVIHQNIDRILLVDGYFISSAEASNNSLGVSDTLSTKQYRVSRNRYRTIINKTIRSI